MKRNRFVCALMAVVIFMSCFPITSSGAELITHEEPMGEPTEIKLEAETLMITTAGSWGISEARKTSDKDCSNGAFYFVQAANSDNGISWEEVKENVVTFSLGYLDEGNYHIYIKSKDNKDRGTYRFSVDGKSLGEPVDMYIPESSYTTSYGSYVEHELGTVAHSGGELIVNAKLIGQNEGASGRYGLVADYFRIVEDKAVNRIYGMYFNPDTWEGKGGTVTISDGWIKSSLRGSVEQAGAVYSTKVGSFVRFQPDALPAGWYSVQFWNIAAGQSTMRMTATINANGITETLRPAAGTSNGWSELGVFYFAGGDTEEYLQFTVTTEGMYSRVADVQFVPALDPGYQAVIWNNEDSCYTETGTWSSVNGVGYDESASRKTTDSDASATWADYPPATSNYQLYYWNPVPVDGENRAALRFQVSSQDGNWRFALEPDSARSGWVKIGTIKAAEGTMLSISVTLAGDGVAYADALMLRATDAQADDVYFPGSGDSTDPAIFVNQLGYDIGYSKHATVVNLKDGTPFQVIERETGKVAFSGTVKGAWGDTVQGGIIDFTELEPDKTTTYYISCGGVNSFDFGIGKNLIYRRTVQQALQFMEETRQDYNVGGDTGYAWRDSHQFSFELNSLVMQYMANPALYNNLTGGISDAAKCVYSELKTQGEDEPDIVWLIKFGAMRYYKLGMSGKDLHMLIKEQLAYFLYVYPEISKWVDPDFYEEVRDFTLEIWGENRCNLQWYPVSGTNHNLYALQTVFGGLKGSQPPGHSIIPNLLMFEVAKRDGLGDVMAERFFQAAYENCAYLISDDFDLTDPYYNKGQRMSEYIMGLSLSYFLEEYPDRTPAGLKEKLIEWAEVNLSRMDNLWEMRMAVAPSDLTKGYTYHTDAKKGKPVDKIFWTGAAYAIADGQNPAPKNEPGNQAGLQAIAYAVARVLDDEAVCSGLMNMGVAAIDDLLGRNPTGRSAFYNFVRDFEGADLGWWTEPMGGYGALYNCTAVIDANAPEATYPYAPENYNQGYTEGWVAYNTAWNHSLAYSSADATTLTVSKTKGQVGERVRITLDAPINLDDDRIESATVWVTDANGGKNSVLLTETVADSSVFEGEIELPNSPTITVSYGIGIFCQSAEISVMN